MQLIGHHAGHMRVERLEGGVRRAEDQTLLSTAFNPPTGTLSSPGGPNPGVAMDTESDTMGIRLLTSALVTPVRCASAMALAGSA